MVPTKCVMVLGLAFNYNKFMQVYSAQPVLGVQFVVEDVAKPLKDMTIQHK